MSNLTCCYLLSPHTVDILPYGQQKVWRIMSGQGDGGPGHYFSRSQYLQLFSKGFCVGEFGTF
ncbi:hypothetical protein Bpfe_030257, partial [Biomphalaria pfeifferi]